MQKETIEQTQLERRILELKSEVSTSYSEQVRTLYEREFKRRHAGLLDILNDELLGEFFEKSTFSELMHFSPDFVVEDEGSYWANHIVNEIENTFHLERLYTKKG